MLYISVNLLGWMFVNMR